jgi:hypothetical protein
MKYEFGDTIKWADTVEEYTLDDFNHLYERFPELYRLLRDLEGYNASPTPLYDKGWEYPAIEEALRPLGSLLEICNEETPAYYALDRELEDAKEEISRLNDDLSEAQADLDDMENSRNYWCDEFQSLEHRYEDLYEQHQEMKAQLEEFEQEAWERKLIESR